MSSWRSVPAFNALGEVEGEAAGQLPAGLAHGQHAGAGRVGAVKSQRHSSRRRAILRFQTLPHRHGRHLRSQQNDDRLTAPNDSPVQDSVSYVQ